MHFLPLKADYLYACIGVKVPTLKCPAKKGQYGVGPKTMQIIAIGSGYCLRLRLTSHRVVSVFPRFYRIFSSRGARGQEKERKKEIRESTCESATGTKFHEVFDGLQHYERLTIHPQKHGLPANCAIDSWPWLSRVICVGGSCALHSCSLLPCKTCGGLDRLAAHQKRPLVRRIILTGTVILCFVLT